MPTNKITYFKNFDSLRGIAAMLVLFAHIELEKPLHGINQFKTITFEKIGSIGVTLFFVLSGFLITYLLLRELNKTNTINIKYFYLRRIYRIWPLYFLILLIGKILYYNSFDFSSIIKCIFFLPNLVFYQNKLPTLIDPIWSIGVEEQFYLFFPCLVLFFRKHLLAFFVTGIGAFYALKVLLIFNADNNILNYFNLASFDLMFIGGLGAFLVFNSRKYQVVLKILYNTKVQYLTLLLILLYFILIVFDVFPLVNKLYGLLFLILLINMGTNPSNILNLEYSILKHLGTISYSLYLTHKFVIVLVLITVSRFDVCCFNIVIYFSSSLLSIILSTIIYNLFEKKFIQLKKKFTPYL